MKILVAPDKYKGSLNSFEISEIVKNTILEVDNSHNVFCFPMADGGDGTIDIIKNYIDLEKIGLNVYDPIFREIKSEYYISKDNKTAFIEMAKASGLELLKPEEQNCCYTSTFGTGQLIKDAILKGVSEIVLTIGGSATNDAGIGIASALGYQFFDSSDNELKPTGINLQKIDWIEDKNVIKQIKDVKFKIACDVNNSFYGKKGSAFVYASQKGASFPEIEILDLGLKNIAKIIKKTKNIDLQKLKYTGAAGGLGGGAIAFLNAQLVSGTNMLIGISKIKEHLDNTDLIITGEGKIDNQTKYGKVINGISQLAKKNKIPCIAICGSVELSLDEMKDLDIAFISSIVNKPCNLKEAYNTTKENLRKNIYGIFKLLKGCAEIT